MTAQLFGTRFEEIYVTAELARRPARASVPTAQRRAIHTLMERMVGQPSAVLPAFVDLAMKANRGVSAGLSLLRSEPGPAVFVWKHLRGSLAAFEGAETPRDFSPCGVTLDTDGPVLSRHPERVYDWISSADIVVPELLLVPLRAGQAQIGTLWIVADRQGHFHQGHAQAMTELANFVSVALRIEDRLAKQRQALEEQEILAREMGHRVKNMFALTESLMRRSARTAASKEELTDIFSSRLHALADAHALVSRNLREVGRPPRASTLEELIHAVVAPHNGLSQLRVSGSKIPCGAHTTNGVALIIHELATNAVKHGALRTADGHVDVTWRIVGDRTIVVWREGSPTMIDPRTGDAGFGMKLLERTIRAQFDGTVAYAWLDCGLRVTLDLATSQLGS